MGTSSGHACKAGKLVLVPRTSLRKGASGFCDSERTDDALAGRDSKVADAALTGRESSTEVVVANLTFAAGGGVGRGFACTVSGIRGCAMGGGLSCAVGGDLGCAFAADGMAAAASRLAFSSIASLRSRSSWAWKPFFCCSMDRTGTRLFFSFNAACAFSFSNAEVVGRHRRRRRPRRSRRRRRSAARLPDRAQHADVGVRPPGKQGVFVAVTTVLPLVRIARSARRPKGPVRRP